MISKIKRRSFLSKALTTTAVTAASLTQFPKISYSKNLKQLKLITTWPKNFPGLGTGAQRVADKITKLSDGRLEVKLYAAGELVGAFQAFDAVSNGDADMFHGASYYWQGKSKAFNFFAAVPFGMTTTEMNAWIYFGGGQKLWDDLAARFNLKPFSCGNTGVQMGGWYNKEIRSVEDYQGLKMRIPGLGGDVLKAMGATPVALPGGEIFQALQSGAIDATEWIGPWNDLAFGLHKAAKYYYYPGFHEPGTNIELTVNKTFWDSLDATDQAIIESATAEENIIGFSEFSARNGKALHILKERYKIQVKPLSPEILKALKEKSEDVVEAVARTDDDTKKIYKNMVAFRSQAQEWTRVSDYSYAQARFGV